MYALKFAYLVSQVHLHCILGTFLFFLFSVFYFLFSIFYFFSSRGQKTQKCNKRISYFFPIRCFLSAFFIFVCSQPFVLWFVAFLCFLRFLYFLFLCVRNLFVKKKNKEFKTALITSFILLRKMVKIFLAHLHMVSGGIWQKSWLFHMCNKEVGMAWHPACS